MASPALTWIGDTDTGISKPAANTLKFSTGGGERLAIEDTKVTSSVDFIYPYYNIIATCGTQSLSASTFTNVSFNSKSSGTGISFSNPTSLFTIPVAGLYEIGYSITMNNIATGSYNAGISINNNDNNQLAMQNRGILSGDVARMHGYCQAQLAANDTVSLKLYQTSAGSITVGGDGFSLQHISINRVHS